MPRQYHSSLNSELGREIRVARCSRLWSIRECLRQCGIESSIPFFADIERGNRNIPLEYIRKLCTGFGFNEEVRIRWTVLAFRQRGSVTIATESLTECQLHNLAQFYT
jgi:transcriptional regulator with XRE-family HTH domain